MSTAEVKCSRWSLSSSASGIRTSVECTVNSTYLYTARWGSSSCENRLSDQHARPLQNDSCRPSTMRNRADKSHLSGLTGQAPAGPNQPCKAVIGAYAATGQARRVRGGISPAWSPIGPRPKSGRPGGERYRHPRGAASRPQLPGQGRYSAVCGRTLAGRRELRAGGHDCDQEFGLPGTDQAFRRQLSSATVDRLRHNAYSWSSRCPLAAISEAGSADR
jgi:hypothetical protein